MKRALMMWASLVLTSAAWAQSAPSAATQPGPVRASEAEQTVRMQAQLADWPNLGRYRANNAMLSATLPGQQRVVFLGDSITEGWSRGTAAATFFPGKPYVNRGISGQTTPQMLVRFEQDVVRLHPSVVVILAGTNDIAGNTGPSTPQMIEDNFAAMAGIAKQNGIRVVLASITPAFAYPWKPGVHPVEEIRELNAWLREFCLVNKYEYLDYYTAMSNATGAMLPGLSSDGVHPTANAYAIMGPLAERAIAATLAR